MSTIEVRQKLREEVRARLFPNAVPDLMDQTDDSAFEMFDE